MNTFAFLLLAFPFYLTVNGKLANYIALAKSPSNKGASPAGAQSSSSQPQTSPLTLQQVQSSLQMMGTLGNSKP